jgi:hypothetical protein
MKRKRKRNPPLSWLLPIVFAIGGAAAAMLIAKRKGASSAPSRPYVPGDQSQGDPALAENEHMSPGSSSGSSAYVPAATAAHATFSVAQRLAPIFSRPTELQNPAPRTVSQPDSGSGFTMPKTPL